MTEKRFQIFGDVIEDMQDIIPIILCNNDKQKQKFYNGLNGLNDENEQLKEENKELKEKNKFILGQIRAFRDDCYTFIDFDGASTLNRLLDILGEEY